jgi:hypothetical protein
MKIERAINWVLYNGEVTPPNVSEILWTAILIYLKKNELV